MKILSSCLFILLLLFSCRNDNQNVKVDFADTVYMYKNKKSTAKKPLYIAISSMTSPEETLKSYNELLNYISQKIDQKIVIKQRKTYKEINELLKTGDVDFAFICSGPYIEGVKSSCLKLLVVPQYYGQTYYQAYIICNINSGINEFEDFKDKSFAFTDPLSTTGKLFPHKLLRNLKTNEDLFFNQFIYTYAHDISIQMVNRGIIDGASVHSIIFDHFVDTHPEKVDNIQIVKKSELFGTPPVVVPSNIDKLKYNNLLDIFLNIHKDSIGREILRELEIEKYVVVNDTIYDSVRKLKKY